MPTTTPGPQRPHAVLFALLAAVEVAAWSYCLWQLLHPDLPVNLLASILGAAAIPVASFVFRSIWTYLAAAVVGGVAFSQAPEVWAEDFFTGLCVFVVVSGVVMFVVGFRRGVQQARERAAVSLRAPENVLVGLSGYSGVGKDTAAAGLLADGWRRAGMSDVIMDLCCRINPLVPTHADGFPIPRPQFQRLADVVAERGWTEAKKIPEVLELAQRVGITCRTVLGEDVLLDALMSNLPEGNLIFTSVRFPNEAQAIKDAGGFVIRVERPGVGPANDAATETAMDDWPFDAFVQNDGTPDQAGRELRRVVAHLATRT